MITIYKKGYYYERKVLNELKKAGWDAWRTPASKSPIDIIAIRPLFGELKIRLIQVKSISKDNYKPPKDELEKLKQLVNRYKDFNNVSIELWVFNKKLKKREIYDVKSLIEKYIKSNDNIV